MPSSSFLSAAVRGAILAGLVAGAVWLATLPAVMCHGGGPWGCINTAMRSAAAVLLAALATSLAGAWLLRLPWFWLVALSGCVAMYAGGLSWVQAAPGLPYWLGFTVSALAWFPVAAVLVLVQPSVSRFLWLAAALVLFVGLVVPPPVQASLRHQRVIDQIAKSEVPLVIPEVRGYRTTDPALMPGAGDSPEQVDFVLLPDRSGDTAINAQVIRHRAGSGPCDRTTGLTAAPDAPCRVLGPDRWEFQGQVTDLVVIRHGDALVVLESPRTLVSTALVEQATVQDATPAELARLS
jgi:hypothetical protein